MNYLSPFFINFYRGMMLLTISEQKKFPLEREIAADEVALGGNEIANEEDDIALALTLAEVKKLKDEIKERPKKSKILQQVTTSELIDQRVELSVQRSVPTKMRSRNVSARSKMKARRRRIEKEGSTDCSEAAS